MLKHSLLTVFLVVSGAVLFAQASPNAPKGEEQAKRMAADSHPVFEAVTIKPSEQSDRLRWWGERGRHVFMMNGKVVDLLEISYGLHPKQIVDGPAWVGTDKYDIDGVPDIDGLPNDKQAKMMFQQMLADRFKFAFHWEERALPAYAITVAEEGPKLKKSAAGPNDFQDFIFRKPGVLIATNESMLDFANGMQRAVMDKPVVDQTGLRDQYDFTLNWTPDESQFIQLGWRFNPPSTDDPKAPPNLFTAIKEQLGLKMEPVKMMVRVMVIDHIEQPSPN